MSDANRTALRLVRETTPGTTPASPRFRDQRVRNIALTTEVQTVTSSELRPDEQVPDITRVGLLPGGGYAFEWAYGAQDDLLRGVLYSDWAGSTVRDNDGTAASKITGVTAASQTVAVAASTGDTDRCNGSFVVGQLVRRTGFTNAANNGISRVTTGGGSSYIATGSGMVDEASPPATARVKVVGIEAPAVGNIAATTSGLAAGEAGAITGTGVDFVALGIVAGMWFKASGFTGTTANNGWCRVLNVTTTRLGCDIVPTGFATDTAASVQVRLWVGDYLRNGTTPQPYSVEEEFQDLVTPEFHYQKGWYAQQLQLQAEALQIISGTVVGLAMTSVDPTTTRLSGASTASANTNEPMNGSANVGQVLENGAAIPGANLVPSLQLTISKNLRRRGALGTLGSVSIGTGRCLVTGTLGTYYASSVLLAKLRAGTATGFAGVFTALPPVGMTNGQAYVIDMPRIKYTGGDPTVSGVDTDRMLELGFQALRSPTFGYTIHVQRFEEYA